MYAIKAHIKKKKNPDNLNMNLLAFKSAEGKHHKV